MDRVLFASLGLVALICAYRAIVAKRILASTLYLACVSAMVAILLYLLGAHQVAVMELSVGAGLVTVLLVYAVSVVGDDAIDFVAVLSRPLALLLVIAVAAFLFWMVLPFDSPAGSTKAASLADVLWGQRALDVWVQIALIFSGVVGVLGLLSESGSSHKDAAADMTVSMPAEKKEAQP